MVTAYLYLRLYLYLSLYLYLCFTIRISVLAFALQFLVACVFLSKPTSWHWSVELYFSQPDFVFVTGPLICISHELTLYFSPKLFLSQRGIILPIFIRLYTRSQRWRSRPFFKLGASNSGLKLSIHMAYQKTNSRSTGEKSPMQPR